MNERTKQLTSNYLRDLLSTDVRLDSEKKQKIIEINSKSELIIFNTDSLQSQRKTYSNYSASSTLKVNERDSCWDRSVGNFVEIDSFLRRYYPNIVGEIIL